MSDKENHQHPDSKDVMPQAQPSSPVAGAKVLAYVGVLLSVLLAGAMAAAAYWFYPYYQRTQQQLVDQQARVEQVFEQAKKQQALIANMEQSLLKELELSLGGQQQDLKALSGQLAQQAEQVSHLGAKSRKAWVLAELDYLLRLANQRLLIDADYQQALSLFEAADRLLARESDPLLSQLRALVIAERAELKAGEALDKEALLLELQALKSALAALPEKVALLRLEKPDKPAPVAAASAAESTWLTAVKLRWQAWLNELSAHVRVRQQSLPAHIVLGADALRLLKQRALLTVQQAEVAAVQAQQGAYLRALDELETLLLEYFPEQAQQQVQRLASLKALQLSLPRVQLNRSLNAVRQLRREQE